MAIVKNSDSLKELISAANLKLGVESLPNKLGDQIIPTIEINPRLTKITNIIRDARYSTSGTTRLVFTADANKEFFLTFATLNLFKDVVCDMATSAVRLQISQDGTTRNILNVETITLTAQDKTVFLNFSSPVKIDKNSSVNIIMATFTVGVFAVSSSVGGYYIDSTVG